jgi:hypothetical protein
MFFEVRIFDSNGDLKKVVTPKRLSNRFWKKNENALPDFRDNELGGDDWSSKGSKNTLKIGVTEDY